VASNWRDVDAITLSYCNSVAQVIKERHAELANKLRLGLPPQYPKEEQKKKSMKPGAVMTTITPLAGVKATSSCQQKPPPPPPPPQNFNSSSSTSNLNQKLSVDEGRRATTRPGSSYIHENMERASATVTPLANIFDEVASFNQEYCHGASNEGHQNISSMLTLMNPTEERTTSLHVHDINPTLYWEKFTTPAPDDEDVVDITDHEVHEMWGLANDE
jgi:hypothetical protein